jgi:hypothetical protein
MVFGGGRTAAVLNPNGSRLTRFADTGGAMTRSATTLPVSRWAALPATLLAAVLPACGGAPAAPEACRYEALTIALVAPREFAGRAGALEVRLESGRDGPDVQSFPDSALAIRRGDARCEVEGGVWQRAGMFVSADRRTLAALESSGSNDTVVFVDTASCRRVGTVDVSGTRWQFVPGRIEATPAGSGGRPRAHPLDAACRPAASR